MIIGLLALLVLNVVTFIILRETLFKRWRRAHREARGERLIIAQQREKIISRTVVIIILFILLNGAGIFLILFTTH